MKLIMKIYKISVLLFILSLALFLTGSSGYGQSATGELKSPDSKYSACLPGSKNDVRVSSAHALTQALANARPGDHIVLENGNYAGDFIVSNSGTEDNPVVIRSASPSGAIIAGSLTLTGDFITVCQLFFKSEDGSLAYQCKIAGNDVSLVRCRFDRVRTSGNYANNAGNNSLLIGPSDGKRKKNIYVGYNEFLFRITKADQFYDGGAIFIDTKGEGIPCGWLIERNRFATDLAGSLKWSDNDAKGTLRSSGVRGIYVSTTPRLAKVDVPQGWLTFAYNLFDNWEGHSGFYSKEKRMRITGNTWSGGLGGCRSRQGDEYEVFSNYFENNEMGLRVALKGFKLYGNIAVNSRISLMCGHPDMGAKGDNPAVDHVLISNRGKLELGFYNRPIDPLLPVSNILIEDHRVSENSTEIIMKVDNITITRPEGVKMAPDSELLFHANPSVENIEMAQKLLPEQVGPDAKVRIKGLEQ